VRKESVTGLNRIERRSMGNSTERKEPPDEPEKKPAEPSGEGSDYLMTTQEVMDYLKVSRTKLWQLVKNEGLPAFKIVGDFRYRKSEVDAWLEAQRHVPEKRDSKDEK
jgi:excisionase family DNA binding protein